MQLRAEMFMAVIGFIAAGAVQAADPIYKSTMPDGRVIYGENPQPGARRLVKLSAPPERSGIVVATNHDKDLAHHIAYPGPSVTTIPAPRQPTSPGSLQGAFLIPDAYTLPKRAY